VFLPPPISRNNGLFRWITKLMYFLSWKGSRIMAAPTKTTLLRMTTIPSSNDKYWKHSRFELDGPFRLCYSPANSLDLSFMSAFNRPFVEARVDLEPSCVVQRANRVRGWPQILVPVATYKVADCVMSMTKSNYENGEKLKPKPRKRAIKRVPASRMPCLIHPRDCTIGIWW